MAKKKATARIKRVRRRKYETQMLGNAVSEAFAKAEELSGDEPESEEARNMAVGELESFADDLDDVIATWQEIDFPGMYSK